MNWLSTLRGEPTAYELEQIRICDALLQYQGGKYASTKQERIRMHVIRAALAAYDPAVKLPWGTAKDCSKRGNRRCLGWTNTKDLTRRPPCPKCGGKNVSKAGRTKSGTLRWICTECRAQFHETLEQSAEAMRRKYGRSHPNADPGKVGGRLHPDVLVGSQPAETCADAL